ncbi:MAG: hypothetical protein ACM3VZ_11245 [Acidobacteriota bacterium]
MPILSMSAGRVTAIWGAAYYRQQDGSLKPVHVGDELIGGQQILTDQEGIVEIEPTVLSPRILKLIQAAEVDHAVHAVNARDPEQAPAAGWDASSSGSLVPGIRVDRVTETLTPSPFDAASTPTDAAPSASPVAQPAVPMDGSRSDVPAGAPGDGDLTLPPHEHGVPVFSLTVSEADLAAHAPTQSVQLDMGLLSAQSGVHLVAPTAPVLTALGQPLEWLPDGQGGLLATAGGGAAAPQVLTAQLDAATGRITVTLLAPLLHASEGQDSLNLDLIVRPNDPALSDAAVVAVSVQDDVPHGGQPVSVSIQMPATNLLIALDTGSQDPSHWSSMVDAADRLLDHYAQAPGEVAVRLVAFADSAQAVGAGWVSVAEAKAWLATLHAGGGLRYDAALPVIEQAFATESGRLSDAHNVSYLFAGGAARSSELIPLGGHAPIGPDIGRVDATEEAAWTRFLTEHQIFSHAIGTGSTVKQGNLDPIAYDGVTAHNLDAQIVPNPVDWHPDPVAATVPQFHGSLLDGLSMGADGFGQVRSITVDGHTHVTDVTDPSSREWRVQTEHGAWFTLDVLTGQYSYVPPSHVSGKWVDAISYTVADRDGDTVSGTLEAVVNPAHALDWHDLLPGDTLLPAAVHPSAATIPWDGGLAAHASVTATLGQLLAPGQTHIDA